MLRTPCSWHQANSLTRLYCILKVPCSLTLYLSFLCSKVSQTYFTCQNWSFANWHLDFFLATWYRRAGLIWLAQSEEHSFGRKTKFCKAWGYLGNCWGSKFYSASTDGFGLYCLEIQASFRGQRLFGLDWRTYFFS